MLVKSETNCKYPWPEQILLIVIFLSLSAFLLPVRTIAQSLPSLKFDTLSVSLWPEYDRVETLVIYRAQLDAETPLPVELSFRLPGHIDSMHAVAYEQDGSLMNVDPNSVTVSQDGEELWLTFSTPSPRIQFEYYDPALLTKQEQTRTLNYHFSTLYPIATTTFEVQQPAQAENFLLLPQADNTFIGNNGLQFSSIQVANMAADETYSLSASYQSNSVDVLIPDIAGQTLEQSEGLTLLPTTIGNGSRNYLGYSLIGVGVVLFVGAGGYWWYKKVKADINPRSLPPQYKRRPARRKKRQAARRQAGDRATSPLPVKPVVSQVASFCFRCGVSLREDSNFCHNCGAERR